MDIKQVSRAMSGGFTLSQIQSRILMAFLRSKQDYLNTDCVLKQVGIALSTWSEEQNRLVSLGLLEKIPAKIMTNSKIVRVMNYRLSRKGRIVALNLFNISKILAPAVADAEKRDQPTRFESKEREVAKKIKECLEIGLDSFGMNFTELVRANLEIESGVAWEDVAWHPEGLELTLNNLFGSEGARTIELMIVANLRSQFSLHSIKSDNLILLLREIQTSTLGEIAQL
ncbi:MAG: hypothetical protein ACYC7D_12615 [Nitrososphaerales archaeon]